jgi:hypothetical protein
MSIIYSFFMLRLFKVMIGSAKIEVYACMYIYEMRALVLH